MNDFAKPDRQVSAAYDPAQFRQLTFHDAVPAFLRGSDSPSAYLDRCLATIAAREPVVRAWTAMRRDAARRDAEESTRRYAQGKPLSPIDGMPIGIKDLFNTRDLPTGLGIFGNDKAQPDQDTACVQALRDAGAVILGKLVTTELGGTHPGPTTNPFNPGRTPGGSSSGSAAAVAARMVPAAIGTQVGGSIIRPAAFCANYALKPTFGALNRGERQGYSQSVMGVHAGSLEDMWQVSIEIARRVGGDPGHPGLYGPDTPPGAQQPRRLAVMESSGWGATDADTRAAFETVLDQLRAKGVSILRRADHPFIESFEQSIADAPTIVSRILAFENKWNLENLVRKFPDQLSDVPLSQRELARSMSLDDYRAALARREDAKAALARLAPICDCLISLSCTGPAPAIDLPSRPRARLKPFPTGNAAYNTPTSMLWTPAVTMPLIAVDGMPVGVQLIGQLHQDWRIAAMARWVMGSLSPVTR